ncbi:hypothetical protein Afil01_32170 [Actinorhabdospora filicis]|uniref:DUF4243 domain-containing protein n=1 Tax=Actinorhabdospora filicis TaxID=1785913 RepID=A0A9W6WB69_9ACTN|nr:questin oxidase family protein [Actinorhabdospora filicis]GLZ78410.1 hypothetical protein Afil01_32170 [Actinorhabdospora filicis]
MSGGSLAEAYRRFARTGPEWGENRLTNHGPMAAEVLVRRGRADAVEEWVTGYLTRLDDTPARHTRIHSGNWAEAIGDPRRVTDWTDFYTQCLTEAPWREVLAAWWPLLLPGIAAGATHGVIRTGHVVRTLLAGSDHTDSLTELAAALAFWAAHAHNPPQGTPSRRALAPAEAVDGLPLRGSEPGRLAERLTRLGDSPDWTQAAGRLAVPSDHDQIPGVLADLVHTMTTRYLAHGHASPVLLVHTATAPNAVLHSLPALPPELWAPSLTAVWEAAAAVHSAYAHTPQPPPPTAHTAPEDALAEAIWHGDEHVIKFTDTAVEVHTRTGDAAALAAAAHITRLIPRT